jgi:hypothetical protein
MQAAKKLCAGYGAEIMQRREFLTASAATLLTARLGPRSFASASATTPTYSTSNQRWQHAYNRALEILAANVQVMPRFPGPVLIEGADYAGIWQECGPHEALVYLPFRPDVARNSHMTFFALQQPDGQLPANNKRTEAGFGQIQMVIPIAATAWELAQKTADDELLRSAYDSCSRWDQWLMRYRNTRGTGLIEGFCTFDTGHDNSPRWAGIPPQCPDKDAKRYPPIPTLPRLCPDLSATVYGARVALAAMANALGKYADTGRWLESAEHIRKLILTKLYVAEDAAFYDLDAEDHFIKVRSDILSRVCGEHVVDQKTFDHLWEGQLHNTKAFWAPYPLPSIALDDHTFVRPIPRNSWGGASQALTALRAGRWFDFYNRPATFSFMMDRWCDAIQRDMTFRQQLDPLTGEFTQADKPSYSPTALALIDFTWRLAGVREEEQMLVWNVRPGHASSEDARFAMYFDGSHTAALVYGRTGAELRLNDKHLGRVESGTARLITDKQGKPKALVGISESTQSVYVDLPESTTVRKRKIIIKPNEYIYLN